MSPGWPAVTDSHSSAMRPIGPASAAGRGRISGPSRSVMTWGAPSSGKTMTRCSKRRAQLDEVRRRLRVRRDGSHPVVAVLQPGPGHSAGHVRSSPQALRRLGASPRRSGCAPVMFSTDCRHLHGLPTFPRTVSASGLRSGADNRQGYHQRGLSPRRAMVSCSVANRGSAVAPPADSPWTCHARSQRSGVRPHVRRLQPLPLPIDQQHPGVALRQRSMTQPSGRPSTRQPSASAAETVSGRGRRLTRGPKGAP